MLSKKLTPQEADAMIQRAIDEPSLGPFTATFSRETIDFIFSNPNCYNVKYSLAIITIEEQDYHTLVAEGLDLKGERIENLIFGADFPCPPIC